MHNLENLCRFVAKVLCLLMVTQGLPVAELSQAYTLHIRTDGRQLAFDAVAALLSPASAEAAPPVVTCVPQVPSDPQVPHKTWTGRSVILKDVAKDEDNNLSGGTYYWDFGDGTQSTQQTISTALNLSTTHTYSAAPDTLFIARLYVTDA